MTVSPFGLAPDDAIRWFREKGYALTFDWRDMWNEQHARAFSLAKMTQLDLLADVRAAIDKALANGGTLREFRKELTPLLQAKGWWGVQKVVDPKTGLEVDAQLGSPRRLRTIYETNLRTALAAGRWERIQRTAQARPYLRYVAIDDGRARREHLAWNGLILPWDHPWWRTHAPPNGWGCRCKLQQLSERDMQRLGYTPSSDAPNEGTVLYENTRTGEKTRVPKGIDPGFAYNPGEVRGAVPSLNPREIPLTDVKTWKDLGRPDARDVRGIADPEVWPRERTPEERAANDRRFAELFGVDDATHTGVLTDPDGVQVYVNRRFLDHVRGEHKRGESPDPGRIQLMPAVKAAVENPFEIWAIPFRRKDGSVVMRKRYIAIFESRDHLVVVDRQADGYVTWTTTPSSKINSQRKGYLLWPR